MEGPVGLEKNDKFPHNFFFQRLLYFIADLVATNI